MKVIFVDIDGVLFPSRAAILPANGGLGKLPIRERASRVVFDAAAVELINRLVSRTAAKIVVHSDWRKVLGLEATRQKLVEQGLAASYFHDDWHTPMHRHSEKSGEILAWLETHRLTPKLMWPERGDADVPYLVPEDPSKRAALEAKIDAYNVTNADHGIDYVVLDDQELNHIENRQIVIDAAEGFSMADYRVALGMLRGADRGLDVYPVSDQDWAMVLEAHNFAEGWGPQISAAAAWLHTPTARSDRWTRARRLSASEVKREAEILAAFGYHDEDDDGGARRMREVALADLPKTICPDAASTTLANALEAARTRGVAVKAELLSMEAMLTASGIAVLLETSEEDVRQRLKQHEILGIDLSTPDLRFPDWQVSSDRKLLPGLPRLFEVLGGDPWRVCRFLKQVHAELGGRSGVDALKQGDVEGVLSAARSVATGAFS